MHSRVFISGRGLITAAGCNLAENWSMFCEGGSAITLETWGQSENLIPIGKLPKTINDQILNLRENKFLKYADDNTLLGILGARLASNEATETLGSSIENTAVVVGTSRGPLETLSQEIIDLKNHRTITEKWRSPQSLMGVTSTAIANDLSTFGPSMTISTSCTSGSHAIGTSISFLRSGFADSAIAGGVEIISRLGIEQFLKLNAYGFGGGKPYPFCPMSNEKQGTVFGSGAAFLFLTTNPNVKNYGEILGFGAASEKTTPTGLSPNAKSLQLAIQRCLQDAQICSEDVDLVIGHGSGTKDGETAELKAYSEVFKKKQPLFNYNKWLCGHLIAAAGPLSIVFATEHLRTGLIPKLPYLNPSDPLGRSIDKQLKYILVTTLGFGGNATAVLIKNISEQQ